jgi:hypothetical protein
MQRISFAGQAKLAEKQRRESERDAVGKQRSPFSPSLSNMSFSLSSLAFA